MTRSELLKVSAEAAKLAKWWPRTFLAYLVLCGGFVWWANFRNNSLSEVAVGTIGMCGFLGFYGMVIAMGISQKRRRQKLGCSCPQCKKILNGGALQLAIASGRCGRCGAVILEDWNK